MGAVDSHIGEVGVHAALSLVPQGANPDSGTTSGNFVFWGDTSQGLHVKQPNGVDAIVQLSSSGAGWAPVRLASAAAITGTYAANVFTVTATGLLAVDGVNVAVNDRILLKNQASGSQNGVYVVTVAGTTGVKPVLTRASDANASADFIAGRIVVSGPEGSINPSKQFVLATTPPVTLDTTALTFSLFSSQLKITDPGTGTAIPVISTGIVPLVVGSAGAETNTLAIPSFIGQRLTIVADTVGTGTRAITSSQTINIAGNTVMTFSAARQLVELAAITVAGSLRWAILTNISVSLS